MLESSDKKKFMTVTYTKADLYQSKERQEIS